MGVIVFPGSWGTSGGAVILGGSNSGIGSPQESRATFDDADASTGALGLATIYAQVGTLTAPRTLTLSDATKALATAGIPIEFLVFDESGTAGGTNKIILSPESGGINGASSVEITAGQGSVTVYTFGGDWFAR